MSSLLLYKKILATGWENGSMIAMRSWLVKTICFLKWILRLQRSSRNLLRLVLVRVLEPIVSTLIVFNLYISNFLSSFDYSAQSRNKKTKNRQRNQSLKRGGPAEGREYGWEVCSLWLVGVRALIWKGESLKPRRCGIDPNWPYVERPSPFRCRWHDHCSLSF